MVSPFIRTIAFCRSKTRLSEVSLTETNHGNVTVFREISAQTPGREKLCETLNLHQAERLISLSGTTIYETKQTDSWIIVK